MKTTTTTHLHMPRARAWFELSPPVAATICIFLLLLIGLIVGRVRSVASVAAEPTPALIIFATNVPTIPPMPTAVPAPQVQQVAAVELGNVVRKAIVVYGAPDLASAIGAVEAGRSFTPLARYGSEWTQVDMSGGTGIVYVRTTDLYGVPELVDLQPTSAPVIIERPVYYAVNQPAPAVSTPEPEQYQIAPAPTLAPQQLVILDRQGWAQQAAQQARP